MKRKLENLAAAGAVALITSIVGGLLAYAIGLLFLDI
jgi:membrane protein YqaA with SNARE-associated domain